MARPHPSTRRHPPLSPCLQRRPTPADGAGARHGARSQADHGRRTHLVALRTSKRAGWSRPPSSMAKSNSERDRGGSRADIVFSRQEWEDYQYWVQNDRAVARRIVRLIEECLRHPFRGAGNPENPSSMSCPAGGRAGSRRNTASGTGSRAVGASSLSAATTTDPPHPRHRCANGPALGSSQVSKDHCRPCREEVRLIMAMTSDLLAWYRTL